MPTQQVTVTDRLVSFVFYCAPLDRYNGMYSDLHGLDTSKYGVTDSASYLTRLPFVVVDVDTKKVIYPTSGAYKEFPGRTYTSALHDGKRSVHSLDAIHIPDEVKRIALHIANDAFRYHRNFQLYPWTVPDAAHSKIHIFELRSDVQNKFIEKNNLPSIPSENTLVVKSAPTNEYYGFLTGDLWRKVSHEYTDADISRLCPSGTISRNALAGDMPHPQVAAHPSHALVPAMTNAVTPHSDGPHAYVGPVLGGSSPASVPAVVSAPALPQVTGSVETIAVDWLATLAPIYAAGAGSRSMAPLTVEIPTLGITLTFIGRALANAINTSDNTTIQQAIKRTSPRTFAAALKAAWRLHIDKLSLSSSWRPMLGSRLHKMGDGLDVTSFEDSLEHIDFTIHNHGAGDRNLPFPTSSGGQKLAKLYAELNRDSETLHGAIYTPWLNWVEPHDTHMHITAKGE
ncbi:hypothetical protein C7401_11070 [Paraburkholderia unamae]|nr:hypothetical protein C7401_11070 [Paraburkholderia unamae]